MAVTYKVWIQIERCDDDNDDYQNETEPHAVATCDTLEEAQARMEAIETMQAC